MKQAEKIFMISDASKQVEVEAHVLRYWEEELQLPVKRNEMGHRYYTREDIALFRKVKELKEQGLQLKAIRNMIQKGAFKESLIMFGKGDSEEAGVEELPGRQVIMVKRGELMQSTSTALQEETREQKSMRLQQLLRDMIVEAVQTNNQEMCEEIKESLLKELDYQFRLQEEKEDAREVRRVNRQEEHYRQIDELLRSHNQRGKKEVKKEQKKISASNDIPVGDAEKEESVRKIGLFFTKNPEKAKKKKDQKQDQKQEEKNLQTEDGGCDTAKKGIIIRKRSI